MSAEKKYATPLGKIKFILLIMPGFSLLSVGGFLDKLRFSSDDEDYGRQLNCSWTLVSLNEGPVAASCGVTLMPDLTLDKVKISGKSCNYFVIFGGNLPEKVVSCVPHYLPTLRHLQSMKIPLVSVDNAAFLLAASGIVKDPILVHWRHSCEFEQSFPWITPETDKNVMENGRIISCPGGNATIELAAFLLEKHLGRSRAVKGLSDMLVAGFAPPASLTWKSPDLQNFPAPVRQAIKIMRQNINHHFSAEHIARLSGLSRRQLDRSLVTQTGMTISQTFIELKMNHACWLMLKTTRTLSQIASDSGFTDVSHLNRHFRLRTGTTPAKWRKENSLGSDL
ncbi:GlxA family transcriptional regulator [Citrobacter freundii]|uniref:GlxA family transcriptional regulator n=1 Tax=Citrobacter freundii TaxID=546 RepID=UPI001F5C28E4|nr:helix-turn-helix domain-containing protein [Citrobacter freundii]